MTEGGTQNESSDSRSQAAPSEDVPFEGDSTHSLADLGSEDSQAGEDQATRARRQPPVVDNQPTVISKRPPVSDSAAAALATPVEMGLTLEGQQLGHFLLEEFVGGGGMGAVFRSVDTLLNRTVAVKVLSQRQSQDAETVRRFKQEAQSAARLDHDNIARVYFVGEHEHWHFIVFEFIEGTNIRDLVDEQGPLEIDDALAYTLQTAEALAHASERDVVHRDIKPSNILITPLGRAKLVDMGLARLQQVEASGDDLTASGVTLGTFDYISPEQARDPRSADVRSDLYSLGCSLYYMLTGRPPFPGGTVLQKLLSHTSDAPPDPRVLRPDLPETLVRILNKLLAKRPDARYQHPRELMGELLLLADELGLPVATRGGTVWLAPSRKAEATWRRHLPWAASIAALLATVLILDMRWSRSSEHMSQLPEYRVPEQAVAVSLPPAPPATLPSTPPALPDITPLESGGGATNLPSESSEGSETPISSSPVRSGTRVDLEGGGLTGDSSSVTLGPQGTASPDARLGPRDAGGVTRAGIDGATSLPPADAGAGRRSDVPAGQVFNPLSVKTLVVQVGGSGSLDAKTSLVDSLEEATALLRSMPNVDLIELEYNGVLREEAISLASPSGRRITIRAAEGYRPEILFQPAADDPVSNPRTMIQISGGSVTLENLAITMEIPQEQVDGWTLVSVEEAELLEMVGCQLTIRNARGRAAYVPNVAFFEMSGRDRLQLMMVEGEGNRPPLTLDIEDSIVRGEATLVRASARQPVRITWSNGMLATTERLLQIQGASRKPRIGERVQLELSHVTAIVDKGICLSTTDESHAHQLLLDVRAADCIFIALPNEPLFAQQGVRSVADSRDLLLYDGRRNFYEGSDLFWEIDAPVLEDYLAFDFEAWLARWGANEEWQAVRWRGLPALDLPVSQHKPEDYALTEAPMGRGSEIDPRRSNAGFDARQLSNQPTRLESPATSAPMPAPTPREGSENRGSSPPSTRGERSSVNG